MNLYQQAGPMTLGSRLRQLSERITNEAAKIYSLYGVTIEPRWFPVFYCLSLQDGLSIAQLAEQIGHSHASVSQIAKEMHQKGLVQLAKDVSDGRKTILLLSEQARQLLPSLQQQITDVEKAVDALLARSRHNIWQAMDELDYLLEQKSLVDRVREQRQQRERQHVQIVEYTDQWHDAFRRLNQEWITKYFQLEEADNLALDHPREKILQPGGHILMALYQGEAVGTCALIRMDETTFELAKMAVSPQAQGKHIGWLLGQAALQKAKERGAQKVYLESNTLLKPAINLYHKLGFQRVIGPPSPYQRANIQMERVL